MFACNGILFNHESPRRGETFVTRKITRAVVRIARGYQDALYLGNLDAKRDWGFAGDYVDAMWRMLQHHQPDDFVIATGESHSVREFVEAAFAEVGITLVWQGAGLQEVGIDVCSGASLVRIDKRYVRPVDVSVLCGDARKARRELGWQPCMSFKDLVKHMVQEDLNMFLGEQRNEVHTTRVACQCRNQPSLE
jgi:GDPmannose 4,6-dehydratase